MQFDSNNAVAGGGGGMDHGWLTYHAGEAEHCSLEDVLYIKHIRLLSEFENLMIMLSVAMRINPLLFCYKKPTAFL
jgi:hypothetical protein